MKNIEKTVRKISKMYQGDNNEVMFTSQLNASHHLYWIMENEPMKYECRNKDRVNIGDMITQQINSLMTDYQVDTNLLISVINDFTRKVFSGEIIRLVSLLEDHIQNDVFRGENLF